MHPLWASAGGQTLAQGRGWRSNVRKLRRSQVHWRLIQYTGFFLYKLTMCCSFKMSYCAHSSYIYVSVHFLKEWQLSVSGEIILHEQAFDIAKTFGVSRKHLILFSHLFRKRSNFVAMLPLLKLRSCLNQYCYRIVNFSTIFFPSRLGCYLSPFTDLLAEQISRVEQKRSELLIFLI